LRRNQFCQLSREVHRIRGIVAPQTGSAKTSSRTSEFWKKVRPLLSRMPPSGGWIGSPPSGGSFGKGFQASGESPLLCALPREKSLLSKAAIPES
jgi:hypothetical protein